jgi:hypothetical protein
MVKGAGCASVLTRGAARVGCSLKCSSIDRGRPPAGRWCVGRARPWPPKSGLETSSGTGQLADRYGTVEVEGYAYGWPAGVAAAQTATPGRQVYERS